MREPIPFETFAPLSAMPEIRHAFSLRTAHDTRQEDFPAEFARQLGYSRFAAAAQPHGNAVAIANPAEHPPVDALITRERHLPLVIRCADCAPVFIIDRATPAIALVHSGKKGTLANIASNTVATLQHELGTIPTDCIALIGPSIGPCHYEMDIRAGIEVQLRAAGLKEIYNPGICTACDLTRYYSYRAEKGQTGRMLALLALA